MGELTSLQNLRKVALMEISSTIATTSITDRKKFSVNYFLQFLTGLLPENILSELI